MDIRDMAIERLIAADPRLSLEATLGLLMAHTHASSVGVFLGQGDVELVSAREVDQSGLDRVRQTWAHESDRLRDGRPVWQGTWCVWPVPGERGTVLIYVAAEGQLKLPSVRETIAALGSLFETAVELDSLAARLPQVAEGVIDAYLEATPTHGVERRQLLAVLNRHEWNLSRVARVLGVTRVTVYKRMARLGIQRLRVRKAGLV